MALLKKVQGCSFLKKTTICEILVQVQVQACLCPQFSNFGLFSIHFHTLPMHSNSGMTEMILIVLTNQVEYSVEYGLHYFLNIIVVILPVVNYCVSFLRVVEFASKEDMKAALKKLDDTELNGKRIRLKIVRP